MDFSRRDTSKLLLAGALASVAGTPVMAQSKRAQRAWAMRFQNDLKAHLVPGCDGTLTLRRFGVWEKRNRWAFAADVRLDWPPGQRTRRFRTEGREDEATYAALLNQSLFHFAKAWPGCVV